MNEHKHTPGEWTIHPFHDSEQILTSVNDDGTIHVYGMTTIGVGQKIIGSIEFCIPPAGYPHVENMQEYRANVALVLAAPQMLEALRILVEVGSSEEAWAYATEVIAKARGEDDADPA